MKLLSMHTDNTMTLVRGVGTIFFVEEDWMKDRIKRSKGHYQPTIESIPLMNKKNDDHAHN